MFKDLTPTQIDKLSVALFNTGNIALGGTLFAQVTNDQPFQLWIGTVGGLFWGWCFVQALIFMQMGSRRSKSRKKLLSK